MLVLTKTAPSVLNYAYDYIVVIFAGIPFTILFNACFGILMAFGNSKLPSGVMGISTVFNVGLDLLFILILDMGVAGRHWLLCFQRGGAGIFCFVWLLKKYPILRPEEDEKKTAVILYGESSIYECSHGTQYSVTAIGAVILQTSINELGEVAVATYSIGSKVKSLFFCPLNAMGSALATFTGQNYGYGDMKRSAPGNPFNHCNGGVVLHLGLQLP